MLIDLHVHTFASGDAIAAPEDVKKLAEATGFWYEWDESRQQFDHPAMLAGIRDGRLARLLVGGSVTPVRLDELVREVSGEFVASYPLPGRVRFRCVQFDAARGKPHLRLEERSPVVRLGGLSPQASKARGP